MGTGYTRQSAASIIDGNVIDDSHFNNEFNAIENAFNATTGHSHDGTLGEGPLISLTGSVTGILPIANGGTGSNLTDPNADRILFWDDSAGAVTWLTIGTGIAITGTTIAVSGGILLADGDKGDITVSSSGTVWELDAGVVGNTEIAVGANIDVSKLGTGVVDNTEFNYLNGVTSAIQTQIDLKAPLASPTFTGTVTVPATNFTVGTSLPFSDSAGTLTLQNVDALDATTEATIEAAIDTLANLTSIQGRTVTLADAGADAVFGWDDSANAYQNLSAADARTAISYNLPITNDGTALGSTSFMWSDLFLASGAIINWNNGNVTITHSTGVLTFTGAATFNVSDSQAISQFMSRTDAHISNTTIGVQYYNGKDSLNNSHTYARTIGYCNDTTNGSEDGSYYIEWAVAGSTVDVYFRTNNFGPVTNDTVALGSAAASWSDLFLASGAVINFNNGDVTLTHSADLLTLAGGNLSIGTSGVFTSGTIELGNASDTTLSRSAAGVLAVEGTVIQPIGSVIDYAGTSAPTGWIFCNGQNVSRTTYAKLFAVLSTTYGAGDGSTTFGIPDLRGRVIAGKDDMGGTSANRLTTPINGDTLGASGGAEAYTSAVTNHQHGFGISLMGVTGATTGGGGGVAMYYSDGANTRAATSNDGGTGTSDINVQPTFILNKIMYAGV